ncbi:hypothetical protein RF11_16415 [Thelohanellus kitauei]|uniref:Uncharacterized protein n=1 Tax=Thelohanellus kitauei TaxID=669202 RepID=A0A0C2N894_THEKT|nr:hypothetical protein RF11_16415 [Thelohanellus kitauei]
MDKGPELGLRELFNLNLTFDDIQRGDIVLFLDLILLLNIHKGDFLACMVGMRGVLFAQSKRIIRTNSIPKTDCAKVDLHVNDDRQPKKYFSHIQYHPFFEGIKKNVTKLFVRASVDKNCTASYYNPKSTITYLYSFNPGFRERAIHGRSKKAGRKGNEPSEALRKEFTKTTLFRAKDDLENLKKLEI